MPAPATHTTQRQQVGQGYASNGVRAASQQEGKRALSGGTAANQKSAFPKKPARTAEEPAAPVEIDAQVLRLEVSSEFKSQLRRVEMAKMAAEKELLGQLQAMVRLHTNDYYSTTNTTCCYC